MRLLVMSHDILLQSQHDKTVDVGVNVLAVLCSLPTPADYGEASLGTTP